MEGKNVRSKDTDGDEDDDGTHIDSPILCLTAMAWGTTNKMPINQIILCLGPVL